MCEIVCKFNCITCAEHSYSGSGFAVPNSLRALAIRTLASRSVVGHERKDCAEDNCTCQVDDPYPEDEKLGANVVAKEKELPFHWHHEVTE